MHVWRNASPSTSAVAVVSSAECARLRHTTHWERTLAVASPTGWPLFSC